MTDPMSGANIDGIDRSGMLDTALGLPGQVAEGFRLPRPRVAGGAPLAVAVLGMGGSALGGDLLSSILLERGGPPVLVNRDFHLPAHVRRGTLVFAVSYSGDTEETLSACRLAEKRGCRVVTLSSGGRLRHRHGGQCHIQLPPGYRPRAALAFMLLPMMGVLEDLGVADFTKDVGEAVRVLLGMRKELGPDRAAPANAAKAVARELLGRSPAVLSGPFLAPAARRWKNQLCENAKVLARDGVLPEMAHNDMVAWAADPAARDSAVVILRERPEEPRLARRFELARRLGLDRAGSVREVRTRGRGALARLLSVVFVGDLASLYLAVLRGVDPAPVRVIERFKRELGGKNH